MTERIAKILAARWLASRRKAEDWITAGRVQCNGQPVSLGDRADPDRDMLTLDGKPLPAPAAKRYIMLHKPRGYVTTLSDEKGRPDVSALVESCGVRVYPVGRLDMDSEGLLLLTNDGEFANRLMHPRHQVEKVYDVLVWGFRPGAEALLRRPIVLDGYAIAPPKVTLLSSRDDRARLRVTIHEGRNRQVRRMCQAAGMEVLRLKRIAEGGVTLGDLKPGTWRELTEEERITLKN